METATEDSYNNNNNNNNKVNIILSSQMANNRAVFLRVAEALTLLQDSVRGVWRW